MQSTTQNEQKKSKSNLTLRIISALIMLPPVVLAINAGGFFYFILLFVGLLLASYEWNHVCGKYSFGIDSMVASTFIALVITSIIMNQLLYGLVIFAIGSYITYMVAKIRHNGYKGSVVPRYLNRPKWFTLGVMYLAVGFASLAYISNLDNYQFTVLWVFLSVAACDTGAYFVGSLIGGKKILPSISPKKTWSGFFGGALASMLVSYGFAVWLNSTNEVMVIAIGFAIAVVGHAGDMIESAFKRYVNVKDTSNLIPGHGGILDRIDALVLVATLVAVIGFFIQKSPLFLPF